eukprot:301849-Hanusia_phi.AAC.6
MAAMFTTFARSAPEKPGVPGREAKSAAGLRPGATSGDDLDVNVGVEWHILEVKVKDLEGS